jgi:hypothetical protein
MKKFSKTKVKRKRTPMTVTRSEAKDWSGVSGGSAAGWGCFIGPPWAVVRDFF